MLCTHPAGTTGNDRNLAVHTSHGDTRYLVEGQMRTRSTYLCRSVFY